MLETLNIELCGQNDLRALEVALEVLYRESFPEEDLWPLVRSLIDDKAIAVSLAGRLNTQIAGHAIVTLCGDLDDGTSTALLGPVAVMPALQKRGIGSAIINAGLQHLEQRQVKKVFVLGDPALYGRFGFRQETVIKPPFTLPAEYDQAWQSKSLGVITTCTAGTLDIPAQWRNESLWIP